LCARIKLEKTYSSRQTLDSILRTRSYLYTPCTRGSCTSTTTWSWPGGENSEEGGAGLRHCRPCGRCGRCRLSPSPPPPSPPLTPPPPSPPAPLLRLPLSHAVGISHPSLPPIAAAHAASVAAASIDRPHRPPPSPPLASPPLPKGEAARERERDRSRLYGYKVRVRVRVRERVATSQSGGPRRIQTSTALRPEI